MLELAQLLTLAKIVILMVKVFPKPAKLEGVTVKSVAPTEVVAVDEPLINPLLTLNASPALTEDHPELIAYVVGVETFMQPAGVWFVIAVPAFAMMLAPYEQDVIVATTLIV